MCRPIAFVFLVRSLMYSCVREYACVRATVCATASCPDVVITTVKTYSQTGGAAMLERLAPSLEHVKVHALEQFLSSVVYLSPLLDDSP